MWLKTTALFRPTVYSDVEWDAFSEEVRKEKCDTRNFRFDTDQLDSYNEGEDKGTTTIRLKTGYEIRINLDIKVIDGIMFKAVTP